MGRFDALFRQLTPLVVLGIALVALFGHWLPGAAWFAERLGPNFVLGFCVFLLSLYVLLLWGESLRLHAMLSSVLRELLEFRKRARGAGSDGGQDQGHKLEAVRLLLPALASPDADVRRSSRQHLARLVGEDLGDDQTAWQQWLDRQTKGG